MSHITQIVSATASGVPQSAEQLLPLVYDELRRLARSKLTKESPGQTLQATALVHEAYLRLVGNGSGPEWDGRGHFFAAAAEAMRRILIDEARARKAQKRGGATRRMQIETFVFEAALSVDQMLDFNEALSRLEEADPQAAQIVSLRVFGGLTVEEAAASLGMAVRSAYRDWAYAQAWLFRDLNPGTG